jgi:hypothetical protein
VKERVGELQADKVVLSKQWVINRLVENEVAIVLRMHATVMTSFLQRLHVAAVF